MDEDRYGELLAEHRPRLIETPEEHERLLTIAEKLMEKGDSLSVEEEQLLALIVLLVEAFETHAVEHDEDDDDDSDAAGAAPEVPTPQTTLQRLMETNGVSVTDIADIFGTPHIAREVLEGSRPISRSQAKQLARYFRVPDKLFRHE